MVTVRDGPVQQIRHHCHRRHRRHHRHCTHSSAHNRHCSRKHSNSCSPSLRTLHLAVYSTLFAVTPQSLYVQDPQDADSASRRCSGCIGYERQSAALAQTKVGWFSADRQRHVARGQRRHMWAYLLVLEISSSSGLKQHQFQYHCNPPPV